MAQKSLQGRWVGRRCPTSCHIIGKGKAPRNSLEQAQEGQGRSSATRAGGLTWPLQGSHLSYASTLALVAVKGPSRKTTGELAL